VQSVLYARRLGRDGPALRPHPVTLIEEPEAHLHPQAQFELPALFAHAQGQIIASTHSAHLVSVAEFRSIRILQGAEGETKVIDLLPVADGATTPARGRHSPDELVEMEKLRRLIERPFGELLFASAVIMGDGATERALLPPLIREALQSRGDGVCVVDPGSMASDLAIAVVNFAKRVGIPWLLFSDSDPAGEAAAMRLIADHGDGDMNRVIWVRLQASSRGWATERMFMDFSQDLCESACRRLGFSGDASRLFKFMMRRKGVLGNLLAEELISRHPWPEDPALQMECWPPPICQLISKLDNALPERSVLP
jgi:predicted ATP-dependent endonuclease of OLD family